MAQDYFDFIQRNYNSNWKGNRVVAKKKKAHPERDLQDAISKYLLDEGFIVIQHNSSMLLSASSRQPVRSYIIRNTGSSAGLSDLQAIRNDKTYFIEVKTPKGVQSEKQKEFELLCKKHGVIYILARSIDDVATIINDGA